MIATRLGGALAAGLRVLLEVAAAGAHERELRGHEEAVEEHQHQDGEQEERRGHAVRRLRRDGAPLLREESSSFIRATQRM